MCAEGLSSLLRKAKENQLFHGIQSSSNEVQISHLLFVDDSMLFSQATVKQCQNQIDKKKKNSIFFSKNTNPQVRTDI